MNVNVIWFMDHMTFTFFAALQTPQPKITPRIPARPSSNDGAVAGNGVLELAIEHEVIHAASLVFRIDFEMN